MKLLVVSDAHLVLKKGQRVAYAPYVKEMDIWMRHVNETTFVCPNRIKGGLLAKPFECQDFRQVGLRRLEFHTLVSGLVSFLTLPYQALILCHEMYKADHIHLRAPGNLVLLASFVQLLFPQKPKTVKYAGNWDPNAIQPLAYRLQKRILSNTTISKNITVLVYGEWPNQSKNITPFFTASYFEHQKVATVKTFSQPYSALFVGTLSANKRPLAVVKVIEELRNLGVAITLDLYGEGYQRNLIEAYCRKNDLRNVVKLKGNQSAGVIEDAYKASDFIFLLSKSEGWPKVLAEAMFYGVIPISTSVSCVPWMLGYGKRGILLDTHENRHVLKDKIIDGALLDKMSKAAMSWSRMYTLDVFEEEIKKILS